MRFAQTMGLRRPKDRRRMDWAQSSLPGARNKTFFFVASSYRFDGERLFAAFNLTARSGHATIATSVFAAAASALRWVKVDRRDFGTARRFRDNQILVIGVRMVPDRLLSRRNRRGLPVGIRKA